VNQKLATKTSEQLPEKPSLGSVFKLLVLAALSALGAGLIGSLLAVVLMGILRFEAGIPTPVELFGDFILKHISVNTFIRLLLTFAPHSKTDPLGLTLLAMVAVGTGLSLLYALLVHVSLPANGSRPTRREWLTALAFALAMTAVGIIVFWNEIRQNFLGLPILWATITTSVGFFADFALYSAALCLVYRTFLPKRAAAVSDRATQGRRQLLARTGVAIVGVGALGGTLGLIQTYLNEYSGYDGKETFTQNGSLAPITPNSDHYVVTQNAIDPTPSAAIWRLEVSGLVNNPGTYTYEEVQQLPSTSRAVTLECIANGVGGHLISTAIWQGVTLSTLLAKHGGAQPNARYVAFYSVDGYNMSLPLDEVLADDALLAWRMNGAPLPNRHGYPMRVLIPGHYGEENPKWLTRVELTHQFVSGLYYDQGWYNGPLHTMSRIDYPTGHIASGKTVEIGGIAFAGNRGIQQVEVSTDGGTSWEKAHLNPALSQDSWVFWAFPWTPEMPGSYRIFARATDGTGTVQTSKRQGTVPNGATGYPEITLQVG
jgi:DMSO/TMAO reductase YedYZ molybdopterin-dependent catalytic subunit